MANIAQIIGGIKPAQIQQQDPFQSMNQSLTLQALLGQGDLQNLQIDTARRSAEKNKRLEALFASNPKATAEDVMAVDLDKGLAYKKSLLDAQQTQSTIGRNNAQTEQATQATQAARIKAARDSLAGVTDQTAYDAWKQANASLPVAQSAPQMFDPQWQRRSVMDADKFITQMTPKFEKVDIGGEIKMVDTNPLTNPGIATINYKKTFSPGDKVTMRGQNMADARQRDANTITQTGKQSDRSADLRKEFNALPEVKSYKTVVPIMNSVRNSPDTPAGDLDLIYGVGKLLDPDSVVREGEMGLVIKSGSPLQRFQGTVNYITSGRGRLPPEQRAELIKMMEGRAGSLKANYDAARSTYEQTADRLQLPKNEIFIDLPQTSAPAAAAPTTFSSMPDPSKFNGRRVAADDGTIYKSDGKKWVRQ